MATDDGDDLDDFIRKIDQAQVLVIQKTAAALKGVAIRFFSLVSADSRAVGLKYGSPVLSGRYYTSHRIAINSLDASTAPVNPEGEDDPYRGLAPSEASRILQNVKLGDSVTISNSLPYAKRIEEGWSKYKAPEGVYQVSADYLLQQYRSAGVDSFIAAGSPGSVVGIAT